MTTALTKALNQSRAFKTTAYDRGANYLIGDKGFDFSVGPATQFDNFHNNYRDKKRYSQYRGWVHAAINAIAKKGAGQAVNLGRFGDEVASPKPTKHYLSKHMSNDLRAKAAEREVEIIFDHPLRKALDNPNDIQGRWQFVYSFIVNLNLTGWAFVVVDTDGDIPKFYSLPTTWVEPVHRDAPFSHFKIVNPEDPAAYHDTELLDRTQVTFAYIPNPANPFQALAPAQAQNMAIGIDEHIQQSQNVFFHNGIFPSIIITVAAMPGGVPGAPVTRPKLSGAQRRQIYAAVRKLSGGVANYGNPAIVDGLIEKFEKLSMDSNEMGWEKSEKTIRSRILSAFGVHPFILGEETAASYAQSWNVKDIFFENVNSYLDMLGSCMTHFVHGITNDESLMCWWDAAVPINPDLEHKIYEGARKRGDVSQNEFRAWMGLPPDLDRNEDVLGNNSTNATTIAVRTAEGRLDMKQAKALLEAMGVPSSKAKDIAGKGPPPGTVPPGQQPPGLPQPQGNLTPEQQQQQETRGRKPEAEEEIEQDIKKAIEALRQPIVIEMKAIENHSEEIIKNCGSGAPGSPGFQPGNTCNPAGGSGGGGSNRAENIAAWMRSVTPQEKKAIQRWTDSDWEDDKVRKCQSGVGPCDRKTKNLIKHLESAVAKAPFHEGTVYRGIDLGRDDAVMKSFLSEHKEGAIVEMKAFTSTSKERYVAHAFADTQHKNSVMMTIQAKTGADINIFSKHPDEYEVLLSKGTKFKVMGINKSDAAGVGYEMVLQEM